MTFVAKNLIKQFSEINKLGLNLLGMKEVCIHSPVYGWEMAYVELPVHGNSNQTVDRCTNRNTLNVGDRLAKPPSKDPS